MKVLHLFKSKPDQLVLDIMEKSCQNTECKSVELFASDINWEVVVDEIFKHDKVICWW